MILGMVEENDAVFGLELIEDRSEQAEEDDSESRS
jgi:hypothetical protein